MCHPERVCTMSEGTTATVRWPGDMCKLLVFGFFLHKTLTFWLICVIFKPPLLTNADL